MTSAVIDFESRSRLAFGGSKPKKVVPEDLFEPAPGTVNAYKYADPKYTEVLLLGEQVDVWPADAQPPYVEAFPLADVWPDCTILAHNLEFEWAVWHGICVPEYGWPPLSEDRAQCLAARAAYQGLPRKLADLTKPLGLGTQGKDKEGHANMLRLSKPQRAKWHGCHYVGGKFDESPERHERNAEYCKQDCRTESLVARLCPPLPPFEQKVWHANREINERGVPIDVGLCRAAVYLVNRENQRLTARLREILDDQGATVDTLERIKTWMVARGVNKSAWPKTKKGGLAMDEGTVQDAVDGKLGDIPEDVLEVLKIRQLSRDAAVSKYHAMLNHEVNGRCQGAHMYYGAGPGRFTANGPQFQNMRRLDEDTLEDRVRLANALTAAGEDFNGTVHLDDVEDLLNAREGVIPTLGGMVRLAIRARRGNVLVVSDWGAIEMRVLHWLAGDAQTLKQIRDFDAGKGEEPYRLAAAAFHEKPVAEITKAERQDGKILVLAPGYCGGPNTIQTFAKNYGVDIPLDKAKEMTQLYRRSYPLVKKLWYKLSDAAVSAVQNPGKEFPVGYVSYYMTGCTLNARLPSGREIKYYDATVVDGEYGPEVEAINPQGGGRRSVGTPILINNIDQGIARDLEATAIVRCREEGLPVVLHVHDEIVLEVAKDHADHVERRLKDIMLSSPRWARGLPLKVGTGIAERYTK